MCTVPGPRTLRNGPHLAPQPCLAALSRRKRSRAQIAFDSEFKKKKTPLNFWLQHQDSAFSPLHSVNTQKSESRHTIALPAAGDEVSNVSKGALGSI